MLSRIYIPLCFFQLSIFWIKIQLPASFTVFLCMIPDISFEYLPNLSVPIKLYHLCPKLIHLFIFLILPQPNSKSSSSKFIHGGLFLKDAQKVEESFHAWIIIVLLSA